MGLMNFMVSTKENELNTMIVAMLDKETKYFSSSFTNIYQGIQSVIMQRKCFVTWSLELVAANQLSNEVVAVAFSNLDRFLGTKYGHHAINDSTLYQIAAFSSLSIAIKMLASTNPYLGSDQNVSHGLYSSKDLIKMENVIMNVLQ